MPKHKVKVKDLIAFVKEEKVLFASCSTGKRLYVSLYAAPNVKRYIVEYNDKKDGFKKRGNAVRYYNEL